MQGKGISLRKLDSNRYYCEELAILIDREAVGGVCGPKRTEWGMAAADAFVYAQRLGDCRDFLTAVLERARVKNATGRTRRQAKLTKVGRRRWRTEDGIEVSSERRSPSNGTTEIVSVRVDIAPDDSSVPVVRVGSTLDAARSFVAAIPWRNTSEGKSD